MAPEFRVWDTENNLYSTNQVYYYMSPEGEVYDSDFGELDSDVTNTVIVEQYTGLKDVEGHKIFEGDIVHVSVELNSEISGYAEVVFESGSFVIKGEIMKQILFDGILYDSYSDWDDRLFLYDGACVVVGNVHDNPELLEVDE